MGVKLLFVVAAGVIWVSAAVCAVFGAARHSLAAMVLPFEAPLVFGGLLDPHVYHPLLQFICHGLRLWDRLRLRKCHIPQVPFLPRNFLLGHLTDLARTQPCYLYDKWRRQLGGIYAIFLGKAPVVVLSGESSPTVVYLRKALQGVTPAS